MDTKTFPEQVDVTLVEGAVSSEEDLEKINTFAPTANFSSRSATVRLQQMCPRCAIRLGARAILQRAYLQSVTLNPQIPDRVVPRLLQSVRPVHQVVKVDVFVPGCPPSAETIGYVVNELLDGRMPDFTGGTRFGA